MSGAVGDDVQDLATRLFIERGVLVNQNGGFYVNVNAIGSTRIAQVIRKYAEM